MKRWWIITTLLYLVILIVLSVPISILCFGTAGNLLDSGSWGAGLRHLSDTALWQASWIAVLGIGAFLLLGVRVKAESQRPVDRRPLHVPVLTAALMAAILLFGAAWSLASALWGDAAFGYFELIPEPTGGLLTLILSVVLLWAMWAGLFYRYFKKHPADDMVGRVVGWLLKGSILELMIAVPCHIVVRHRQDCCAPFATFWGISMGVGVMLLSFGPGVLFLFMDRMKRKRPTASLSSSP